MRPLLFLGVLGVCIPLGLEFGDLGLEPLRLPAGRTGLVSPALSALADVGGALLRVLSVLGLASDLKPPVLSRTGSD